MGSSLFPQSTLAMPNTGSQPATRTSNLLNLNMASQTPTREESNQQQILALWSMVKGSNNPQQIISNVIASNPQMKQLMDMASAFSNPQEAFYQKAREQGVDPNSILNLLK